MWCTSSVAQTFVVSVTMSSFNPLSFTIAYHTLHTHGLSLSQSLCSNGLPPTSDTSHLGCMRSYYLHPSHHFFPLGVWLCLKNELNGLSRDRSLHPWLSSPSYTTEFWNYYARESWAIKIYQNLYFFMMWMHGYTSRSTLLISLPL